MIVVADTSPLHYLVLLDLADFKNSLLPDPLQEWLRGSTMLPVGLHVESVEADRVQAVSGDLDP